MEPNRTGRTVIPGQVIAGRTIVPGAAQGGLDKMLEVVGGAPDPAASHAFLLVISGAEPGRLHVLDRPEVTIGRSRFADIHISERALSQQHAKLVRHGEFHRIFDLGSTNGTFVNDRRVQQADLRPGDVLRTGETVFTYMAGGQSDTAEATMSLPAAGHATQAQGPRTGPITASHALVRRPPQTLVPPRELPVSARPQVLEIPAGMPAEPDLLTRIVQIIEFVRRYWLSIAICFLLGGAAGAASYRFRKPPARAEFELSLVPDAADNPIDPFAQRKSLEFFRNAQNNFLRPALIHETLKQLGETDVTADRIRLIQSQLTFTKTSQFTYSGSFDAPTADQAIQFLEVHLKLYREAEIDKALKVLLVEVETLDRQVAEAEERLNTTEAALTAFKQENSEGLPEQAAEIYRRQIELGAERTNAMAELALASADVKAGKARLQNEAPEIESRIEEAKPYADAIATAKKELAALRAAGKGEQHPDVVEAQQSLAAYESLRDEVMERGTTKIIKSKNPVYSSARNLLAEAEAKQTAFQSKLSLIVKDAERLKELQEELPRLEAEYSDLTRSYTANQAQYTELLNKLTTTRTQLEIEQAQAAARYDVITPPNVKPVSRLGTIIKRSLIGAALGLFFGIALGIVRDLRRFVAARLGAVARR
jgi:uncharacterized protein involved in exopolysaccharide biosynthesis